MKTDRASKAFEDFTGRRATRTRRVQLPTHDVAGWEMGPVLGIAYQAKRDGETDRYFHEFAKADRPNLVSSDDGEQLYIVDGQYIVTERGIEDMSELFVVNPRARGGARKLKRNPMAAKTRRRTASGRFTKRAAGGTKRRKRRTTRQVAIFQGNPSPRHRRRPAARKTVRRKYRRNPSSRVGGAFTKMIPAAAGIGAGAVLAELAMGALPIPHGLKTGIPRHLTKAAVGLAGAFVLAKFLRQRQLAKFVGLGAVVIAFHDVLKEVINEHIPMLPHDGFGMAQYVPQLPSQFGGMAQYVPQLPSQFGYINPAGTVSFSGASQAYNGGSVGGETSFRA